MNQFTSPRLSQVMKKLLLINLTIIVACNLVIGSDSLKVIQLLQEVEQRYRNLEYLSYASKAAWINPTQEDSIYEAHAEFWIKKRPQDPIFGAILHAKGADEMGRFDYYYDGQQGLEIRHDSLEIDVFEAHLFPGGPNNPAKARTALVPFISFFLEEYMADTLLKFTPTLKLAEQEDSLWVIEIHDDVVAGHERSKRLYIGKKSKLIWRIEDSMLWMGTEFRQNYDILTYQLLESQIENNIELTETYPNYKRNPPRRKRAEKQTYEEFLNQKALNFDLPFYKRGNVKLEELKGKLVLLDFWESWCGYCLLAMPKLKEMQENFGKDHLVIVGISSENRTQIERLIEKNELNYLQGFASKKLIDAYKISARPTYFLIDTSGTIVSVGHDLDKMEAEIAKRWKADGRR